MIAASILALVVAWALTAVQFVYVQHFRSNAVQERVTFQPPNEHTLNLNL